MTKDRHGWVKCPECDGAGKVTGSIPGVPQGACVKLSPCEACWPRDEDGEMKFWNDGTAGWVPAEEAQTDG
jgi:hypothetical protein